METEIEDMKCSFCGKSQNKFRKLIAGPNVFICNECVYLCIPIIREELSVPDKAKETLCKLCGKTGNHDEMLNLESRGYMCQECIPFVYAELKFWNGKSE